MPRKTIQDILDKKNKEKEDQPFQRRSAGLRKLITLGPARKKLKRLPRLSPKNIAEKNRMSKKVFKIRETLKNYLCFINEVKSNPVLQLRDWEITKPEVILLFKMATKNDYFLVRLHNSQKEEYPVSDVFQIDYFKYGKAIGFCLSIKDLKKADKITDTAFKKLEKKAFQPEIKNFRKYQSEYFTIKSLKEKIINDCEFAEIPQNCIEY